MKKTKIMGSLIFLVIVLFGSGLIKPVFGAQIDALKKKFLEVLVMNGDDKPIPVNVKNLPTAAPVQIETPEERTKRFGLGNTFIDSGKSVTAVDVQGSGKFLGLWYSANSPIAWARISIDGEEIWKGHTHGFCLNWYFFAHSVGFAGATNCNESPTHLGDVWGGYITPPTGFPFRESLKVEFGNDDNSQKLIYSALGYYSIQ